MTTTRIILASLLGAIAMFIWSFIAHTMLPLGKMGIQEFQNEEAVLAAMKTTIGDKGGMFLFPGMGIGDNPTNEQQKEAMTRYPEKLVNNPSGFMVYHPPGSRPLAMPRWLAIEFLTEFLQSLIVVSLLAKTRIATFGGRFGFFLVAGILATIATNISYWNWHGFSGVYTAAYMTMQFVGYLCAGLAAAFVLRNTPPRTN